MLPSRALGLPAHAHDDARIIELLNLCASRQLFTPTPLHIGVVPGLSHVIIKTPSQLDSSSFAYRIDGLKG